MTKRITQIAPIFAFLLPFSLLADQITLKNGDHLSGTVQKLDGKNLIIKSDLAGVITVPFDAVTEITTTAPLTIGLKDGKSVVGPTKVEGPKVDVQTATAGPVETQRDDVLALRNMEEQKAYDEQVELYRHPSLLQLWTGSFNLGIGLAQGNSNTFNLTTGFNAVRDTHKDKTTLYFASIYTTGKVTNTFCPTPGNCFERDVTQTTANSNHGGVIYNRNLTEKLYVWGQADFASDQFQELELQVNPSAGFGWHAIKTDTSYLDLLGGGSFNQQYYTAFDRSSAELVVGDEYDKVWRKRTHVHQSLRFFPNMSYLGQYRVNFDLVASTAVNKLLTLNATFSDRYTSNPPPGTKDNDLILSAGIGLTFSKLK
jgi:putative salt-induced outer membrane protein YdiY